MAIHSSQCTQGDTCKSNGWTDLAIPAVYFSLDYTSTRKIQCTYWFRVPPDRSSVTPARNHLTVYYITLSQSLSELLYIIFAIDSQIEEIENIIACKETRDNNNGTPSCRHQNYSLRLRSRQYNSVSTTSSLSVLSGLDNCCIIIFFPPKFWSLIEIDEASILMKRGDYSRRNGPIFAGISIILHLKVSATKRLTANQKSKHTVCPDLVVLGNN